MNAKEAYEIATVAAKDKIERRFNFIMRQIEAAAADGKFSYVFYAPLQDELVERLTDLGYEVNRTNYTIGWRYAYYGTNECTSGSRRH